MFGFQQLSRLLKSKNPDDLQAANRLIKNMVKEVSVDIKSAGYDCETQEQGSFLAISNLCFVLCC